MGAWFLRRTALLPTDVRRDVPNPHLRSSHSQPERGCSFLRTFRRRRWGSLPCVAPAPFDGGGCASFVEPLAEEHFLDCATSRSVQRGGGEGEKAQDREAL